MRYFVPFLLLFISMTGFTQVKDISPILGEKEKFFDLTADKQGNLYLVKTKRFNGEAVLRRQGGVWNTMDGHPDKPVSVTLLDDKLYLITEVPNSSDHYRLLCFSNKSWHVVPTAELDGSVINIMLLPNKQLVVRGKFNFAGGIHRFAMLSNGKWEPVALPSDTEITDIFAKYTSFAPQRDAQGVLYFYGSIGGSKPGKEVVRWDGTNWKKSGLYGNYQPDDIAVAPNGNIYAGNASPAGLLEWNGNTWNLVMCNAKDYDGGAFTTAAVNEKNEVFVAGAAKNRNDHIVYKYSKGKWTEFAKIPAGPITSMYYNGGNLYVQSEDYKLFQVSGAEKAAQK